MNVTKYISNLIVTHHSSELHADACNAEDLHIALKVKNNFRNWIGHRIKTYRFVEGTDYVCRSFLRGKKNHGGHNKKQYIISLDMAKELCMLEKSDIGRMFRRYFIEAEKRLRYMKKEEIEKLENRLLEYKKAWSRFLEPDYLDHYRRRV